MKNIEEYLSNVRQLIQGLSQAQVERYEEEIFSLNRGNLRIRLRFSDQALLEISEAIVIVAGELHRLSFRYHYQDQSKNLVFRYDNAPHHPEIPTHPDHKHEGDQVLQILHPSLEEFLLEVQSTRAGY